MAFSVLGYAVATALTRDLEDRQRAAQLSVLGGVLGNTPLGLVVVASAARPGRDGGPADGADGVTRTTVPDVAGRDEAGARKLLTARRLRSAVVRVESDRPIGEVLGSEPDADAVVAIGSAVSVLVSAGLPVPDVRGMAQKEAEQAIAEAGFGAVVKEAEGPGDKGKVQAQRPAAGSRLDRGAEIALFVVGADVGRAAPPAAAK